MIKGGLTFLFLWNKLGTLLFDEEKNDDGPEIVPVENH